MDTNNGIDLLELELTNVLTSLPDVNIIICGDFNGRTANEIDYILDDNSQFVVDSSVGYVEDFFQVPRISKDKEINVFGRSLLDLCCTFGIHMLNGRLGSDTGVGDYTCITHNGTSTVDYVLVSSSLFYQVLDFTIDTRVESDHMPLTFTLPCCNRQNEKDQISVKVGIRKKCVWAENRANSFTQFICSEATINKLNVILENPDIETIDCVKIIHGVLEDAARKCHMIRSNKSTKRNQPIWFDTECTAYKRKQYKLLRRFRLTNNLDHLREYQDVRNKFRYLCRAKKREYLESQRANLMSPQTNSKLFWSTIRRNSTTNNSIPPAIQANKWHDYFRNLFSYVPTRDEFEYQSELLNYLESANEFRHANEIDWDILNGPITKIEIIESIKRLKNDKSPGPDGLIGEYFKSSVHTLLPYLHVLFNKIFDSGKIPIDWSSAIIIPIYKKGARDDPGNYRAISLLDIFGKIFTSILNVRLTFWADALGKINEEQAGFRHGYSTFDNIFILQAIVQKYITKKRGKLYCAFVDFSKAFDNVERQRLWYVLLKGGVNGKMFKVLHNIYANVKSCVKTLNGYTEYFHCPMGVRQGCMLSPFLFSFFINELCNELNNSQHHGVQLSPDLIELFCLLFADDVAIFSDSVIGLQRLLDKLELYCERWSMSVNLDKTKIIVFKGGGHLSKNEKWVYGGMEVNTVSYYKYLGIMFSCRLHWSMATKLLAQQAKKAFLCSFKALNVLRPLSYITYFKVFDTMILPILTYGAEVWGFRECKHLERVQYLACRKFLGVSNRSPNSSILGECGRYPIYLYTAKRCIKYWTKLICMPNSRYPKKCYNMLYNIENSGTRTKHTWISDIQNLLFICNMNDAWQAQEVGNVNAFINIFVERFKQYLYLEWRADICTLDKLDTYCQFKITIEPERYLFSVHIRTHMQSLARLRCSSHCLRIEKDRGFLERNQRTCELCDMDSIENEFHFLLVCTFYNHIRYLYIPHYFFTPPTVNKFLELLRTQNDVLLQRLAAFVFNAMKLRRGAAEIL